MAWKKYSQGLFFNQKRLYKCHHQYIVIHEQLHSTYHAPASHFRRDLIESYLSYAKSEDHVSELHVRMFSLLIEEMFGNSERHDINMDEINDLHTTRMDLVDSRSDLLKETLHILKHVHGAI